MKKLTVLTAIALLCFSSLAFAKISCESNNQGYPYSKLFFIPAESEKIGGTLYVKIYRILGFTSNRYDDVALETYRDYSRNEVINYGDGRFEMSYDDDLGHYFGVLNHTDDYNNLLSFTMDCFSEPSSL